ncbi:MAG: GSCFA domain-containing protein [Bacteroidetes bacterium]|nr:MAG: GSCFA domain-containing protein [Bacteroidota bacterium]
MQFMLDADISAPRERINYRHAVMLVGSCFTEHMYNSLAELKFDCLLNPNGILFDPWSVSSSLISYIQNKQYEQKDLFFLNEVWQSWQHHSKFSNMDPARALLEINASQSSAHTFLKRAKWLIITLGTAFSYRLIPSNLQDRWNQDSDSELPVANCHRAPAQWFRKFLMPIEEINAAFDNCVHQLFQFNPDIQIIFTVSPVRHIRDGVVDNNRSKARLIEVVHLLAAKFDRIHYFPAYELVIDVLRDYRFYDIDLVHPNYQATEFVLEKFEEHYIDTESRAIMKQISTIVLAKKHKAFQPDTQAHKKFLQSNLEKASRLKRDYPFLDLDEELKFFSI